jgi:threonine/homoserine/homoserine lactone efflux protein
MSIEVFLLYLGTWALVALTPGPAVMFAMSQATRFGFRRALAGILGIQLGHFVFFACVAYGLAALLAKATTAFAILRIVGALYLVYLGVRIVISTFRRRTAEQPVISQAAPGSLILQGFAIQVTNPKALLFMSALLPQFIRPQHPLSLQLIVLLATTIAVDTVVLGAYAFFALRGAQSLRASGFSKWLERVFGATLVFFGARLLASRN